MSLRRGLEGEIGAQLVSRRRMLARGQGFLKSSFSRLFSFYILLLSLAFFIYQSIPR